jgi:hypothetical protein
MFKRKVEVNETPTRLYHRLVSGTLLFLLFNSFLAFLPGLIWFTILLIILYKLQLTINIYRTRKTIIRKGYIWLSFWDARLLVLTFPKHQLSQLPQQNELLVIPFYADSLAGLVKALQKDSDILR